MKDPPGLAWSHDSVYNFWSIALAAVETAEIPSGKLAWIRDDTDSTWYTALHSVALNLICQFAVMSVNSPFAETFRVPLRDVLRSVPTFKGGFADLSLERKSLVLIADISADLSRINLDVHKYETDSEVALPLLNASAGSSPPDTPPPSARACSAFVDVATKNKALYKQAAREEKSTIHKQRA